MDKMLLDEVIFQNTEKPTKETWEQITADDVINSNVPVGGISISKK